MSVLIGFSAFLGSTFYVVTSCGWWYCSERYGSLRAGDLRIQHFLNSGPSNQQCAVDDLVFPKVSDDFLGLINVQGEIVSVIPLFSQVL